MSGWFVVVDNEWMDLASRRAFVARIEQAEARAALPPRARRRRTAPPGYGSAIADGHASIAVSNRRRAANRATRRP